MSLLLRWVPALSVCVAIDAGFLSRGGWGVTQRLHSEYRLLDSSRFLMSFVVRPAPTVISELFCFSEKPDNTVADEWLRRI